MQGEDRLLAHRKLRALLVDEAERLPGAPHLLLGAVAREGGAEHDGADTSVVHLHALDAVGGHGALDDGVLTQDLEPLGRLPGKKSSCMPLNSPRSERYQETIVGMVSRP